MCVAVPGKIISIEGTNAKVDFNGNLIPVNIGVVKAQINDYVLVHAGCAIEVLQKEKAEELLQLLKDLEDIYNE